MEAAPPARQPRAPRCRRQAAARAARARPSPSARRARRSSADPRRRGARPPTPPILTPTRRAAAAWRTARRGSPGACPRSPSSRGVFPRPGRCATGPRRPGHSARRRPGPASPARRACADRSTQRPDHTRGPADRSAATLRGRTPDLPGPAGRAPPRPRRAAARRTATDPRWNPTRGAARSRPRARACSAALPRWWSVRCRQNGGGRRAGPRAAPPPRPHPRSARP